MANVSEAGEIYSCEICGNVVNVMIAGGGELFCCDEPMIREEEYEEAVSTEDKFEEQEIEE